MLCALGRGRADPCFGSSLPMRLQLETCSSFSCEAEFRLGHGYCCCRSGCWCWHCWCWHCCYFCYRCCRFSKGHHGETWEGRTGGVGELVVRVVGCCLLAKRLAGIGKLASRFSAPGTLQTTVQWHRQSRRHHQHCFVLLLARLGGRLIVAWFVCVVAMTNEGRNEIGCGRPKKESGNRLACDRVCFCASEQEHEQQQWWWWQWHAKASAVSAEDKDGQAGARDGLFQATPECRRVHSSCSVSSVCVCFVGV